MQANYPNFWIAKFVPSETRKAVNKASRPFKQKGGPNAESNDILFNADMCNPGFYNLCNFTRWGTRPARIPESTHYT
jgi:hypothetical protein